MAEEPEGINEYEEIQLNGQWYYFGLKIKNPDGYEVRIRYTDMVSFEMVDDILNWGHTAVLLYDSQENAIERTPNPYQEPPPEEFEEGPVIDVKWMLVDEEYRGRSLEKVGLPIMLITKSILKWELPICLTFCQTMVL